MWRLWPRRRAAIKNYDDLRADVIAPRLLVVVCVPEDCEDWTRQTEEHLCLVTVPTGFLWRVCRKRIMLRA